MALILILATLALFISGCAAVKGGAVGAAGGAAIGAAAGSPGTGAAIGAGAGAIGGYLIDKAK
ncbi:MAG: glycine zipper family protein [Thermodesulfobacteriota bacterium]